MLDSDHQVLESWALKYGVSTVLGYLCSLLLAGKAAHHVFQHRGLLFGCVLVPPVLISGMLGLVIFSILDHFDRQIASDLQVGLSVLKTNLINFVFATFVLGLTSGAVSRTSSQHSLSFRGIITSIFHEGLPMVIYSQILIWGQSTCCIAFICVVYTFSSLEAQRSFPSIFAALVPLGLEAGDDVAVPTSLVAHEWSKTIVEEAESLGLIIITILNVVILSLKPHLIAKGYLRGNDRDVILNNSYSDITAEGFDRNNNNNNNNNNSLGGASSESASIRRRGGHADDTSPLLPTPLAPRSFPRSLSLTHLEGSGASDALSSSSSDRQAASLGIHISLIALTVFLSFLMLFLCRLLEMHLALTSRPISGIRMFKLAMFCAVFTMLLIAKRAPQLHFKRSWFMRLCGLFLDLIIIAAFSHANLHPHMVKTQTHYAMCFVFVCICLLWNGFCFAYVARELFPNYWFERGLTLSADSLGHAYTGLLFVRTFDPSMESPVPTAYAYKLMMFFIPSSYEKNNIVVTLLGTKGPWIALLVCLCICASWLIIFDAFFKDRYVAQSGGKKSSSRGIFTSTPTAGGDAAATKRLQSSDCSAAKLSFDTSEPDGDDDRDDPLGESEAAVGEGPGVQTADRSSILTNAHMELIRQWLPPTCQHRRWSLRYSLRHHGTWMDTLLAACRQTYTNGVKDSNKFVVVIEDSWGYVFGAFVAHPLEKRSSYYGSGENFVFSILPSASVFRWTRSDDSFVISDSKSLIFGGGSGGYAIQLDEELDTGVSFKSETYDNAQLSSSEFFKCLNCEVWSLDVYDSGDWI